MNHKRARIEPSTPTVHDLLSAGVAKTLSGARNERTWVLDTVPPFAGRLSEGGVMLPYSMDRSFGELTEKVGSHPTVLLPGGAGTATTVDASTAEHLLRQAYSKRHTRPCHLNEVLGAISDGSVTAVVFYRKKWVPAATAPGPAAPGPAAPGPAAPGPAAPSPAAPSPVEAKAEAKLCPMFYCSWCDSSNPVHEFDDEQPMGCDHCKHPGREVRNEVLDGRGFPAHARLTEGQARNLELLRYLREEFGVTLTAQGKVVEL